MSVTAGSYTVGSGGNYSQWFDTAVNGGAWASIGTPLTGNLTLTQISNTNETVAGETISIALAGYTLLITSAAHKGNPTAGYKINMGVTGNGFAFTNATSTGIVEFSNLNMKRTVQNTTSGSGLIVPTATVAENVWKIHDCILDENATALGNTYGSCIARSGVGQTWNMQMFNLFLNDFKVTGMAVGGTRTLVYENITIYSAVAGATGITHSLNTCTIRNFYVSAATCYGSNATVGAFCASSDLTGTVGLRSLSASTQLQSTDITAYNFMDVLPTGKLWQFKNAMTYLPGHTTDIHGRRLPNNRGYHSIGASAAWANQVIDGA
jgi:hypothetical protein